MPKGYDFSGWVTKNNILCSDGAVIQSGAFRKSKEKVPLVWNHDYSSPNNILGHIILQHRNEGTYGYGYFNSSQDAKDAKELVKSGDINAMSIGAKDVKKNGNQVVQGSIYEVSLVLDGANSGAFIDTVITHSSDDEERIHYQNGYLIHSSDEHNDEDDYEEDTKNEQLENESEEEYMPRSIYEMNDEDQDNIIGEVLDILADDMIYDEGDDVVKHNIFAGEDDTILKHDGLRTAIIQDLHSGTKLSESIVKHGITDITVLFPETQLNGQPMVYDKQNTIVGHIMSKVSKTPFAKIKNIYFDMTADEARAKGYLTGKEKKEQVFKALKRETTPQTVYKKQKLDRDDIIDMKDFNIIPFIKMELDAKLKEEIARALMVGDGRDDSDDDKIKEDRIRPIIKDEDIYTIKATYTSAEEFVDKATLAMADYRGVGMPILYIHPKLLASLKLLKDKNGLYLYDGVAKIANLIGVSDIMPCDFLPEKTGVIVNLEDYQLGANKGGEVTTFEDFDIDFNQHKYLIETRLSGALRRFKSAIYIYDTTLGEINTHKESKLAAPTIQRPATTSDIDSRD